jgi:hypothetical protein
MSTLSPSADVLRLARKASCLALLVLLTLGLMRAFESRHNVPAWQTAGLLAERDRVTTVFVGSSQTYRHLDPVLFDSLLRAGGKATHSVNLGRPGASLIEVEHTVAWLLRQDVQRLTTCVVEVRPLRFTQKRHLYTARLARSYTPRHAWSVLRAVPEADASVRTRLGLLAREAYALVRHATLFGRGVRVIESNLAPAAHRASLPAPWLRSARGYLSLDAETDSSYLRREQRFASPEGRVNFARRASRARRARQRARRGVPPTHLASAAADRLLTLARRLEARGVRTVFYVPPSYADVIDVASALRHLDPSASFVGETELALAARLQEKALWFDRRHLHDTGARLLTTAVARQMADLRLDTPLDFAAAD